MVRDIRDQWKIIFLDPILSLSSSDLSYNKNIIKMNRLGQTLEFSWDTCICKIGDDQETVKSPSIWNFPVRWKPAMLKMQCVYVAGTMAIRCLLQVKMKFRLKFFHLQSQSKLLWHFFVFWPSQCWFTRFGKLQQL